MPAILGARTGAFGRATYFETAEPVAEHAHPHAHLLFKAGGGDRRMTVDGEIVAVTADQCVLINPWQKHADLAEQPGGPSLMLVLYIYADWLTDRLEVGFASFDGTVAPMTPVLRDMVARVGALLTSPDTGGGESADDLIGALVAAACAGRLDERYRGMADCRIRHALRKLRENPHLHIDYADVARDVGLSRSRFYQQFRSSVGVAPNMFVDGLVLEEAYQMMREPGRPLDEIASSLGFSAQSSFTRFFRDRVGFPPSLLRRQIERGG